MIERESTLHLGDTALTRANVLERNRVDMGEQGEGFLPRPESFAKGLRRAQALAAPPSCGDRDDVLRDTAALVHLLEAEGVSSSRMLFVGRDRRLRIDQRSIRDHLVSSKAGVSRPHRRERALSLDLPSADGESVLADAVPADGLPVEAVAEVREARELRAAVDAAIAQRRARTKEGSARRHVLDHARDLLTEDLTLTELARRTGMSKAALSEAWSAECAALRRVLARA